jgi:hypothetical protein
LPGGRGSDEMKWILEIQIYHSLLELPREQGCQMVYFLTKKQQFGQVLEGLETEMVGIF